MHPANKTLAGSLSDFRAPPRNKMGAYDSQMLRRNKKAPLSEPGYLESLKKPYVAPFPQEVPLSPHIVPAVNILHTASMSGLFPLPGADMLVSGTTSETGFYRPYSTSTSSLPAEQVDRTGYHKHSKAHPGKATTKERPKVNDLHGASHRSRISSSGESEPGGDDNTHTSKADSSSPKLGDSSGQGEFSSKEGSDSRPVKKRKNWNDSGASPEKQEMETCSKRLVDEHIPVEKPLSQNVGNHPVDGGENIISPLYRGGSHTEEARTRRKQKRYRAAAATAAKLLSQQTGDSKHVVQTPYLPPDVPTTTSVLQLESQVCSGQHAPIPLPEGSSPLPKDDRSWEELQELVVRQQTTFQQQLSDLYRIINVQRKVIATERERRTRGQSPTTIEMETIPQQSLTCITSSASPMALDPKHHQQPQQQQRVPALPHRDLLAAAAAGALPQSPREGGGSGPVTPKGTAADSGGSRGSVGYRAWTLLSPRGKAQQGASSASPVPGNASRGTPSLPSHRYSDPALLSHCSSPKAPAAAGSSGIVIPQAQKAIVALDRASTVPLSVGQQPSTQQPSTQQPPSQHPSSQHPSSQHPSTQHPSTQHPSTQHPSPHHPSMQHHPSPHPSHHQYPSQAQAVVPYHHPSPPMSVPTHLLHPYRHLLPPHLQHHHPQQHHHQAPTPVMREPSHESQQQPQQQQAVDTVMAQGPPHSHPHSHVHAHPAHTSSHHAAAAIHQQQQQQQQQAQQPSDRHQHHQAQQHPHHPTTVEAAAAVPTAAAHPHAMASQAQAQAQAVASHLPSGYAAVSSAPDASVGYHGQPPATPTGSTHAPPPHDGGNNNTPSPAPVPQQSSHPSSHQSSHQSTPSAAAMSAVSAMLQRRNSYNASSTKSPGSPLASSMLLQRRNSNPMLMAAAAAAAAANQHQQQQRSNPGTPQPRSANQSPAGSPARQRRIATPPVQMQAQRERGGGGGSGEGGGNGGGGAAANLDQQQQQTAVPQAPKWPGQDPLAKWYSHHYAGNPMPVPSPRHIPPNPSALAMAGVPPVHAATSPYPMEFMHIPGVMWQQQQQGSPRGGGGSSSERMHPQQETSHDTSTYQYNAHSSKSTASGSSQGDSVAKPPPAGAGYGGQGGNGSSSTATTRYASPLPSTSGQTYHSSGSGGGQEESQSSPMKATTGGVVRRSSSGMLVQYPHHPHHPHQASRMRKEVQMRMQMMHNEQMHGFHSHVNE